METKVQEQHCNKDNKEDTNNDENDCPKTSSNNNTNTRVFTDLLNRQPGYSLTFGVSLSFRIWVQQQKTRCRCVVIANYFPKH